MKLLLIFLFATLLISCSNTPEENKSNKNDSVPDSVSITENNADISSGIISNQNSIDSTGIEFGFCNMDGKKMLLLADSLSNPSEFFSVIAADYKIASASYRGNKKATSQDNGRQNEFNFDNCKGYLFEIKEKEATPDHSVVFMTSKFVSERKLYAISIPAKKELSNSIQSRIETGRNRKIKDYRCLTILGKDSSIYIVEFENKGDSALAVLALITPGKIVYEDFPASYNDVSTWRVDDGGSFGVEYFDLLAVFEKNGKLEIVTDWPGAEGCNTEYLKENAENLKV